MKTKFKKLSDSRVEITVTLEAKDLQEAEKKALAKLAKTVNVQGFRKGKVPMDVARKFVPENDLNAETIDLAVRSTVIEAFRENTEPPQLQYFREEKHINEWRYSPAFSDKQLTTEFGNNSIIKN